MASPPPYESCHHPKENTAPPRDPESNAAVVRTCCRCCEERQRRKEFNRPRLAFSLFFVILWLYWMYLIVGAPATFDRWSVWWNNKPSQWRGILLRTHLVLSALKFSRFRQNRAATGKQYLPHTCLCTCFVGAAVQSLSRLQEHRSVYRLRGAGLWRLARSSRSSTRPR